MRFNIQRYASSLVFLLCANFLSAQQQAKTYPTVKGYLSFVNPIVTFNKDGVTYNFSPSYTIGFPCGINILKSDRFGLSFELAPFINFSDSNSKTTNILFHPGLMFRYPHGFTFISRMAFETAGRFGVTPVFNKIVIRTKTNDLFIALSAPVRFGNNKPASIGVSLQFGILF